MIAFAGYAGAGKDVAATNLITGHGYKRRCFGDIIKRQVDGLVLEHFGFSAFTEDRSQKVQIRRTLESWGEDNYDAILEEFMTSLPERVVNTRLVRVREANEWCEAGGVIWEITRPGVGPATQWEADRLEELRDSQRITRIFTNDQDPENLAVRVFDAAVYE